MKSREIHLGQVGLLHLLFVEFDLIIVLLPHVCQSLSKLELILHLVSRVHFHQPGLVSAPGVLNFLRVR